MDIDNLKAFVRYCNERLPIGIGVICHTDMSDGQVIEIKNNMVFLNHYNKGYDQWWKIKDVMVSETNLSKYGINRCLENYIYGKY